jgi:predicted transcriptional regulator
MTEQHEQRYCIKFCQKLGDAQVETIRKIQQAIGDNAMSNSQIKEWYNRFKDGPTSVLSILTEDLGMRRVSAKFVPKLLTMEQKQQHPCGSSGSLLPRHGSV